MKTLCLPIQENEIRSLKVGDEVQITGLMLTARDMAHKYMIENWPQWVSPLLLDGAIYHCGPVVKKTDNGYIALSAGPTTSYREEPYEHRVIAHYRPRIIIGKGGMGLQTLAAMKEFGAVYVHATGGTASILAQSIAPITRVHMLEEFGAPEAFWELPVQGFNGIVTMDAHGQSLHDTVKRHSEKILHSLL